ncbi:MAG: N(4)-(beta-N-acetylglucosaminyl)-L-asparaginase [Cyclobacteriaceae bacterium]|nr:N(4)-(beta-N-acetylglucosaminyl)-L-asparaginase [Cyclobacteriaceae bacterium]MDW8332461.1 N(4)-(beta-N-acetylglucosaminyl)-L-asparaginase [Cyclobacteriaceae bacterium]
MARGYSRRNFLRLSALAAPTLLVSAGSWEGQRPKVISTWRNTLANAAAWEILQAGGYALDAVEAGARVPEANPDDMSVGYGGLPDRDGFVTLDASIMDEKSNCGSVAFVQGYKHVISVARRVMEKTPHVMLVGKGAEQFAAAQGFRREKLLTPQAEKAWREWLKKSEYKPYHRPGQHDTIGILALDSKGRICGACTTSGMAFKMHGRVGDSPIIGAGLYVDGEVGAATATGVGEEMIRIAGSHTVVELMRQGYSPQLACEEAVKRVIRKRGEEKAKSLGVAFIAMNLSGQTGAYSTTNDFEYTVSAPGILHEVFKSSSYF